MNVLLVEDDPHSNLLLRSILAKRGHVVLPFYDAETAQEEMEKQLYPLVLLDVSLPRMSGLDLARWIRAQRGGLHVFIFIVTGDSDPASLQRAFDCGADDYLAKPLALDLLNFRLFIAESHVGTRSEIRRIEEALGAAVRGWHSTFDAISNPIFLLTDEGLIHRCNKALAELLALPIPKLLGQSASVVIKDSANPSDVSALDTIHLGRRRKSLLLARSDRWYDCSVDPLTDGEGNSRGVIFVMTDVTERLQAEEALKISEENYRGIYENSVEGIFQTTPDGQYLSANPALVRIYGYESSEDLKASVLDIAHSLYVDPQRRDDFRNLMQEHNEVTDFESQIYRKDRSIIWISESSRAVRDKDGGLQYYEGTVMDITARKNAEEQLRTQERENNRLQAEVDVARAIQERLLPRTSLNVPGLFVAGTNRPATETSGDYFDYISWPDGKCAVAIADVSGHGLGSALIMTSARAYVRSQAMLLSDPGKILRDVNNLLERDLENGNFLSLCLAVFDPAKGELHFASAGHDAPMLFRPGERQFAELLSTGPLLGILPNAEYGVAGPFKLFLGDVLVFMTDGLFECMNPRDETFGKERVQDIVAANAEKSAAEILEALMDGAARWTEGAPQSDDVTLVIVKVGSEFVPTNRSKSATRRIRRSGRISVRSAGESGLRKAESGSGLSPKVPDATSPPHNKDGGTSE